MKKLSLFLIFTLFFAPCFSQSILDPSILDKVQASVFEVVTDKPQEGDIEYEKPLPFSKLPFSIRNDKYNPIGTAFITEDGQFYSAAHVFNLYEQTVYKDYYIRDRNGNVYKVDQITKFSTNRDFISFTVENFVPEEIAGLSIAPTITLNTAVFSVGNALGDGIVIRNGNLTSQTYEEENGEWKWLRFSAAASPGNSGGPLITPNGEVLGIITMKSENENLNYALPFSEVSNIKDNTGYTYIPYNYSLPNIVNESFPYCYTKSLTLPMSLESVQETLISDYDKHVNENVKVLSEKFAIQGEKGLATIPGKAEVLNTYYGSYFPTTFYLADNGKWRLTSPETKTHQLNDGTTIEMGSMMNLVFAEIYTEELYTIEELISNPKLYMDKLFEANRFSRGIGGENIVITSIGEPKTETTYVDFYDRLWQVCTWNIDFADASVVSYALPLPDGIFTIFTVTDNSLLNSFTADIAFLTDFMNFTLFGTVEQWKEYYSLPENYLPKTSDHRLVFNINEKEDSTELQIGEYHFEIKDDLLEINDSTNITICTSVTKAEEDIILTYRSIDIYTNKNEKNYKYIHISRHDAPLEGASKNTVQTYTKRVQEVAPYNGEPYNYEQYTYLDTVVFPEGITEETKSSSPYIYMATFELEGQNKYDEIRAFSKEVLNSISFVQTENAKNTDESVSKTEDEIEEKSSETNNSSTSTETSKKKYFSIFK